MDGRVRRHGDGVVGSLRSLRRTLSVAECCARVQHQFPLPGVLTLLDDLVALHDEQATFHRAVAAEYDDHALPFPSGHELSEAVVVRSESEPPRRTGAAQSFRALVRRRSPDRSARC